MVNKGKYFLNPPQVWDAKTCERMAKRRVKDGYGNSFPKGHVPQPSPLGWGYVRYNGGCWREGEWWEGEVFPVPIVADGFQIINVPSWGKRIVKIEGTDQCPSK